MLEAMTENSSIEDAFDFIEHRPTNGGQVRLGTRELFNYQVAKIIEEHLNIDVDDKRITHREITSTVEQILIDIKEDQIENELTDDIVSEFNKRKGEALSQLLSSDLDQYTLIFPLNLGLIESAIGELAALEGDFQRIDQNKWVNDYFEVAKSEDDTFFKEFLDVSPNDFLSNRFAYYQIQYKARSYGYALSRVQDLANLAVGKLNYCLHQRSRSRPRPTSDSALPYETWAALKEPAFYLIFKDGKYQFSRPMDYGYRRNVKTSKEREQEAQEFYSLPLLSENDPVDADLINAILAYQDGLTEISKRKSFFSFWRGIENLSQIDSPKSEIKDRCRFGLEYVRGEDAVFPTLEKAHEEIDEIRNSLAHEGVHIFVGEDHRNYAKVLLDGMIELYIQERGRFDRNDFDIFLEYGVEYQKSAGKIISMLRQSGFDID